MPELNGFVEANWPIPWPPEVLRRIERVFAYHQDSKLTPKSWTDRPPPDWANRPSLYSEPIVSAKLDLPKGILPIEAPTVQLLLQGRNAVHESQINPDRTLRSLASWLYYSNGIHERTRQGQRVGWLRTLPSQDESYPCELYVAAFGIEGLEPGLYHYHPLEFSLRRVREGLGVLAALKRGRPDLDYLSTSPAAVLVSTIFARASWIQGHRGYRTALLDAGHQIENLMQAGAGLGMLTTARLRLRERGTRELIGMPMDAPFEFAESVQGIVTWRDSESAMVDLSDVGNESMPPISRKPLAASIVPFELMLAVHEDCVAPGVVVTDIRPPLTGLSAVEPEVPSEQRSPVELPLEGNPLGPILRSYQPIDGFKPASIPRDAFLAINQLACRGGAYPPIIPDGRFAGIVRPIWVIADVTGMESGIWYYNPPTDRWTALMKGVFREDVAQLCAQRAMVGDAAAVCVLAANVQQLMIEGGPDSYRLAHLEAGVVAQRMHFLAAAYGLAAVCSANFFDDDFRAFFGIYQTGWELLYTIALGEPSGDGAVHKPA